MAPAASPKAGSHLVGLDAMGKESGTDPRGWVGGTEQDSVLHSGNPSQRSPATSGTFRPSTPLSTKGPRSELQRWPPDRLGGGGTAIAPKWELMGPELSIIRTWAAWYGDSTVLSTAITSLHLGGMLLGGGLAIASDRSTLRALRRPEPLAPHLAELDAVHRFVVLGLSVTCLTGGLMLAADLDGLLRSPIFWIKMGTLATLIANGWRLRQTARCLEAGPANPARWRERLRSAVVASLVLWFLALGLGAALPTS